MGSQNCKRIDQMLLFISYFRYKDNIMQKSPFSKYPFPYTE